MVDVRPSIVLAAVLCFLAAFLSLIHCFLFQVSFVIMALLTNIIIDGLGDECAGGETTLAQILMQIFINGGGIFDFCRSYPSVRFFIAPPNIRNKPSWYPRFRPTILRVFQQVLSGRPQNLQALEDYPGTLDNDGIHFNLMSGILYVQDMFDQSVRLMLQPSPDVSIR